ncbi:hypothetical protein D8674_036566 [Pyrus ussuriensis x Pyrus communis]|uniref:Uncharacterized protein n=1 Tax=Pyrus ussuriensis x Pyrus communis TaxID=2448454 RepID=A0A5N5IF00_9ROSA|nr:hypothetical protein D8674_036566 [Pyrus ussuriensis x Pyrus communis]
MADLELVECDESEQCSNAESVVMEGGLIFDEEYLYTFHIHCWLFWRVELLYKNHLKASGGKTLEANKSPPTKQRFDEVQGLLGRCIYPKMFAFKFFFFFGY